MFIVPLNSKTGTNGFWDIRANWLRMLHTCKVGPLRPNLVAYYADHKIRKENV